MEEQKERKYNSFGEGHFILPKVGEESDFTPDPQIINVVTSVYSEDSLTAVIREIISNSVQWGKSKTVWVKYDRERHELSFMDDGSGVNDPQKLANFTKGAYGKTAKTGKFNKWNIGMTSIWEIALRDTVKFKISNYNSTTSAKVVWEWNIVKNLPTCRVIAYNIPTPYGVHHEIVLKSEVKIDDKELENIVKKVCFWYVHEQKILDVFLDGKKISYPEIDTQKFCERIDKTDLPTMNDTQVLICVNPSNKNRPDWFSKEKNSITIYFDGNYVTRDRYGLFGSFNIIVLLNTTNPEINDKLTAGKMEVKEFQYTTLFTNLKKFLMENYIDKSASDEKVQDALDTVLPFIPKDYLPQLETPPEVFPPIVPTKKKAKRKKYKWKHKCPKCGSIKIEPIQENPDKTWKWKCLNILKGEIPCGNIWDSPIVPPITRKPKSPMKLFPVNDPTEPFSFLEEEEGVLVLTLNILVEKDKPQAYLLTRKRLINSQGNINYEELLNYIIRGFREMRKPSFKENKDKIRDELLEQDRAYENSLRNMKHCSLLLPLDIQVNTQTIQPTQVTLPSLDNNKTMGVSEEAKHNYKPTPEHLKEFENMADKV